MSLCEALSLIMGKRREARERAVQFLFQYDLNPPEDLDAALNQFWQSQRAAAIAAVREFLALRSDRGRPVQVGYLTPLKRPAKRAA